MTTFKFENLVLYFGSFIQLNCGNFHRLNSTINSNNDFLLGQEISIEEIETELKNSKAMSENNINDIVNVLKQNQSESFKMNIFENFTKESSQNKIIDIRTFYLTKDLLLPIHHLKTYCDHFDVLVTIGGSIEDSIFSCKNMSNVYACKKNYIIECILNYVHNKKSSFDEHIYYQLD